MTTIITRLYKDEQTANGVAQTLLDNHFRSAMMDVITSPSDAHAAMTEASVPSGSQAAYAPGLEGGNSLLVVRAPFGAAEAANRVVDATDSVDVDLPRQSTYVATDMSAQYNNSILKDHPRFMSSGMYPTLSRGRSTIAMLFGKPLKAKKVNLNSSLYRGTKYWANFPIAHLSNKPRNINNSIYRGTKFWANFPLPHLTSRERDPSLY